MNTSTPTTPELLADELLDLRLDDFAGPDPLGSQGSPEELLSGGSQNSEGSQTLPGSGWAERDPSPPLYGARVDRRRVFGGPGLGRGRGAPHGLSELWTEEAHGFHYPPPAEGGDSAPLNMLDPWAHFVPIATAEAQAFLARLARLEERLTRPPAEAGGAGQGLDVHAPPAAPPDEGPPGR